MKIKDELLNSKFLEKVLSQPKTYKFSGRIGAFPEDWVMTKISRITANISPGPFNRMMGLTTEQVAMIHGTTPFPTTTSKRPSHPKAGILRALVQSIGEDIGRVSEGRPAIVGLLFGSDELNQIRREGAFPLVSP